MTAFTLPPVRRNFAMFLYIWYVYKLAGGTATDMLVHFPAKRSRSTKEIHPLVIAAVSITSNLSNLPSGTSKRRASVSQIMPKNNQPCRGLEHALDDRYEVAALVKKRLTLVMLPLSPLRVVVRVTEF